jgi:hypothetical protein
VTVLFSVGLLRTLLKDLQPIPGGSQMTASAEMSYDSDTLVPGWIETVESWHWEDWLTDKGSRIGWVRSGSCPRCQHTMADWQETVIVEEITRSTDNRHVAWCNCQMTHTGRSDSDKHRGCGQHGRVANAS